MGRMYQIGKPFESLQDYAEYPHNKLYWHGKLIGKAVTDNWQFCRINRGIKDGSLLKAELINGYKYYNCDITVKSIRNYEYEVKTYECSRTVIARTALEAKAKVTLEYCDLFKFDDSDDEIFIDAYTIEKGE